MDFSSNDLAESVVLSQPGSGAGQHFQHALALAAEFVSLARLRQRKAWLLPESKLDKNNPSKWSFRQNKQSSARKDFSRQELSI
jgi:hypothetical protein